MNVVLASNNDHKWSEFVDLCPWPLLRPSELGLSFDCDETGDTYFANALQKAQALRSVIESSGFNPSEFLVLSDDSGIEIEALGGRPGLHSARFGGPDWTGAARNQLMLDQLSGTDNRRARYVCCLVAATGPDHWLSSQATWSGTIATAATTGTNGFGYDPIFYPVNHTMTVADLDLENKRQESHRAQAVRALLPSISQLILGEHHEPAKPIKR